MLKKVHFETLGCKLNQIESESAARAFEENGFSAELKPCTSACEPDTETVLCIVNTCTVTTKAEQKARRIIRLLLEKFPESSVLVTGCYAEVEPAEIRAINERVAVLAGKKKDFLVELPAFINKYLSENVTDASAFSPVSFTSFLQSVSDASVLKNSVFRLATDTFKYHSRASIKIQDGCNNNCAYCRIHFARGKSVSLAAEEVLSRVAALEKAGQAEVVLTGVNLSQYVSKAGEKSFRFADLLEYLLANTERINFRISSLYPDIVDEKLCAIIKSPRVRPHFHLSVQSGSDRILTLMKRPYNSERVTGAAEMLRKAKPGCFLACDIIAGFPGETDEDFQLTMDAMKKADFTWIHAFPFSPRPGTEAYSMKPKVPESVSKKRVAVLTEFAENQKKEYISRLIGQERAAIVEKRRMPDFRAVTDNFLHIRLEKSPLFDAESLGGKEVLVRIDSVLSARSQTEDVEAMGTVVKPFV